MARRPQSKRKTRTASEMRPHGQPSVFTCPDCSGTLFIIQDGNLVQFRCRIGHIYSPESMLEAQDENVERLMWSATRALEEQSEYIKQMSEQIAKAKDRGRARQYLERSRAALQKAQVVRKLLTSETVIER